MRRLLTILLLVAGLLAVAVPASAHSALVSASPGPGDKVAPGTTIMGLTFAPLRDAGPHQVGVSGPDGKPVASGRPLLVDGTTLCLSVAALDRSGVYTVSYSTVAADGDPQQSRFYFQVTDSGRPSTPPAACQQRSLPPPSTAGPIVQARSRAGTHPLVTAILWVGLVALIGMAALVFTASLRNRKAGRVSR
jgi:methionine-rich copper-binding protein CopC